MFAVSIRMEVSESTRDGRTIYRYAWVPVARVVMYDEARELQRTEYGEHDSKVDWEDED